MKLGRSLQELAAELDRQREAKRDLVASTDALRVLVEDDASAPELLVGNDRFEVNEIAHDQLATYAGIPATYYDRLRDKAPGLFAENVNHWLGKAKDRRLVRTLDGRVRAFLSSQYRPLENYDLAEAILPVLSDRGLLVLSAEVTERRLYIKAVSPDIKKDVPTGKVLGEGHNFFDTLSPAVVVINSEVGLGRLVIESGIFTQACTNLALVPQKAFKRRHVGSRLDLADGEDVRHLLTDEARQASDRAIYLQARDVVAAAFDEAKFETTVAKVRGLVEQKIEGNPVQVVEVGAKRLGLVESEQVSVLKHLIQGGDLTRYGFLNAITRTAEDAASYDRAYDLERIGGEVIDLPAKDWQVIATAA